MTGVVLLAFFAYFYLPHVLFKAAADLHVDLGRKQNASQFEEITSAVLPSAVLHLMTFIFIRLVCAVTPLHAPGIDWTFIGTALSGEGVRQLSSLERPQVYWTITYAVCLAVVAIVNGVLYGKTRLIKIVLNADPRLYPDAAARGARYGRVWAFGVAVTFFWDYIYSEYYVPIHRWSVLSPHVFVKTKEAQLLHGRFLRYDRNRNGEIEAITLDDVSRYSREKPHEILQRGVNPISHFEGEIYIKWNEVADINVTTPGKLAELWQKYESQRQDLSSARSASNSAHADAEYTE